MNNFFMNKLEEVKKKTQSELTKKVQGEKVNLIREALKNDNIEISADCVDVSSLKRELKDKLPEISYDNTLIKIDGISKSLDELLENLENSSSNSIQKFFKKSEKFFKPIAKATTLGLASRAAVILAPTVVSKLVVSGVLVANSVYKIVKNKKAGKVISKESECNKILNELEITRNSAGGVTDTRFSEEVQVIIRDFLKTHDVNFLDTGYLSLRQTIYTMDFEKRKMLCNIINNKLGKGIDVNGRIDGKKKNSLFTGVKKVAASAGAGFATGVGAATTVNAVNPAILSGLINGSAVGVFTFLNSGSTIGGVAAGGGTVGAGFLAQELPIIGGVSEATHSVENLISCSVTGGIIGAGVGVASILGVQAVKTIKNMHNQFSSMKEQKKILEFDSFKYGNDNKVEIEKMQEVTLKSNTPEEQILFNLVYEYMTDEMKVEFKETPTTLQQLTQCIDSCDKKQKAKLHSFVGKLRECNNDKGDFANTLAKVGYAAKTVATVGLAGLSTLDILKDGTLLPEISRKLFKDVPNNIYLMIPNKPEIEKMDYRGELTNRTDDYGMIENVTQAKENYQKLEGMQKEVGLVDASKIAEQQDQISSKNDIIGSWWGETAWNWGKRAWNDTKEFFTTPLTEHLEVLYNRTREFENNLIGDTLGKTTMAPDVEKINSTINGLPEDQLLDLAYYYNMSPDIDKTAEAYQTIGNAMQAKLDVVQESINEYNTMMTAIDVASKTTTGAATVGQAAAVVTDKQK